MNFAIKKVNNPIIGTRIVHLKQSENNKRLSSVRSVSISNIVVTLPMNLQVVNFQSCECMCHECQAWVKLQLALHLLLLTILQLWHLPLCLPPPASNSCLFTWCQPLYASCCTVLLYFSRYCTARLKLISHFLFLFVCYVLFVWKVL